MPMSVNSCRQNDTRYTKFNVFRKFVSIRYCRNFSTNSLDSTFIFIEIMIT